MTDDIIRRLREAVAGVMDKGPFEAVHRPGEPVVIQSDDFEHDAALYVYGDFADDDQRLAYAMSLAALLNAAYPDNITAMLDEIERLRTELTAQAQQSITDHVQHHEEVERLRRHVLALEGGLDAVLEFASTVAGSSSWWEEVWPEHSSAIDAARAAEQSDERRGE